MIYKSHMYTGISECRLGTKQALKEHKNEYITLNLIKHSPFYKTGLRENPSATFC